MVYLVGAGPGDPKLITLKGLELLKTCDVVIYDRLVSHRLLDYVKEDCIKIYVGKRAGHHSMKQDEINALLIEKAKSYTNVVRLKGGDPFVFGRGGEEIEELQKHNLPYEVVSGVTSAIAVPASIGIPVTHRGASQSFHVITGHTSSLEKPLTENYEALAKLDGTLIFLMGLSHLDEITEELKKYGKDKQTPAAVISNGTMQGEKVVRGTIENIASKVQQEQIKSPSILVIGKTAKLQFAEHKKDVLFERKIGIIGTKVLRDKIQDKLEKSGAQVYTLCDMQVEKTKEAKVLEKELKYIEQYQWILFTSQNAIKIFFETMQENEIDRRKLSSVKFAVIGSGTKETLKQYGYYADFMPSQYTTLTLATEFSDFINKEEKVLIPRAVQGSKDLIKILEKKQIKYKEINLYDVKGVLTDRCEFVSEMDCLVFASTSGAKTFFQEMKKKKLFLQDDIKIACIGTITEEAVKREKQKVDIIAKVNDTDGLVKAICEFYKQNRREL